MRTATRLSIDGQVDGSVSKSEKPARSSSTAIVMVLAILFLGYILLIALLPLLFLILTFVVIAGVFSFLFGGGTSIPFAIVTGLFRAFGGLIGSAARVQSTGKSQNETIEVTAFRVVDPANGRVYQCIAEGRLADGLIKQGDDLTVNGFVGISKSIYVTRIANKTTGISGRPVKPAAWWIAWAARLILAAIVVYFAVSFLTS